MANDVRTGNDSATDLLIHNFEICVRTNIDMMKIPLVVYGRMIDTWAKAIDSMVDEAQSRY